MKNDVNSRYEEMFYQALRIRRVEEKIIDIYPTDKIQSPVHLSIGQEAVAVGVCSQLKENDLVFINYRGHAFYLAKGGPMPELMAELYGRRGGLSKGKAGSMHLAAPQVGIMGASAVVASTIPHAVGAGLASKICKKDQISVAVFGDGATEEGVYHESLNFAALHKLPVLFLCENNGLAVHTHLDERQSYSIQEHASVYGIKTFRVEAGYDLCRVEEGAAGAIHYIRENHAPAWLEITTCRYKEHVGPGEDIHVGYRDASYVENWKSMDPLCTNTQLIEKFDGEIAQEVEEAVLFAERSDVPGLNDLLTDVL